MRIVFWFFVGHILLARVGQVKAQDSLGYPIDSLALTQSAPVDAATLGKWRLSGFVGYHQQYQQGYLSESLYLTHGLHASVATDYFVGRHWGIGLSIGYQNLAVSDLYKQDPSIPKDLSPRILPLTSLHSFMLTVGPAFSFPLGRRLSLDIDLRGGLFYNDAPVLGAYRPDVVQKDLLTGTLLATTVIPSDRRVSWGISGFAGLKYQFTPQLSVGLVASNAYSSFEYTRVSTENYFTQKRVDLRMVGVQAGVSYRFASASRRAKAAPVVPPTPICYPPLLDAAQPNLYEVGTPDRPVFKWRSSAPVYTEGERYTFRLYTLPGNNVLYENVVQEPQLVWPAQVPLPDTTSYYFYTLYTSRSDEFGQSCHSTPVVGTLGFFKRQPTVQTVAAVREPANAFTLRLYRLRSERVVQASPQPTEAGKRSPTATRQSSTRRSQAASQRIAVPDSTQSVLKITPKLIYEGPAQPSGFAWPAGVDLPALPTVYQSIVNRVGNQERVNTYYLMVEPDGCHAVISEATKNTYLRTNSEPIDQPKPDFPSISKGQP